MQEEEEDEELDEEENLQKVLAKKLKEQEKAYKEKLEIQNQVNKLQEQANLEAYGVKVDK